MERQQLGKAQAAVKHAIDVNVEELTPEGEGGCDEVARHFSPHLHKVGQHFSTSLHEAVEKREQSARR